MARYRKKPVVIEAVPVTWATWGDVCALVGEFPPGMRGVYLTPDGQATDDFPGDGARIGLLIPTLEGEMLARDGDYLIKGVQSELYPCKPEIFEATYEAVPDGAP